MFSDLQKRFMQLASGQLKTFICPKCGVASAPFQNRALTSLSDSIVCPKCSFSVPFKEAVKLQAEVQVNPPGPFPQPPESTIERKPVSETEVLFFLPARGKSNGLLAFAVVWILVCVAIFGNTAYQPSNWISMGVVIVFFGVGFGLLYAGLRMAYSVHLLYLSPDRTRLQRQLFGRRKNYDLITARITTVKKTEFYQQNYKPVYGIEISSPEGKIRFGSILSEEEKNWLRWEIREFVKAYSPDLV